MNINRRYLIVLVLSMLLLLDVLKPFRYVLTAEFFFIGLSLFFLYFSDSYIFTVGMSMAYVLDCLSYHTMPIILWETVVLFFLIRAVSARFKAKTAKILTVLCALFVHISMNEMQVPSVNILFLSKFIVTGLGLFFFFDFILYDIFNRQAVKEPF